jgi:hypothetical protein
LKISLLPDGGTVRFVAVTVWVGALPITKKKNIYQHVLKLGSNEASAQGLQNTQ